METIWIVIIIAMLVIGLFGTFIPVLPSTAIGWIAMLILYLVSDRAITGYEMIWISVAAVVVQLLDFLLPLWGVKLFGGTKKGVRRGYDRPAGGYRLVFHASVFYLPRISGYHRIPCHRSFRYGVGGRGRQYVQGDGRSHGLVIGLFPDGRV